MFAAKAFLTPASSAVVSGSADFNGSSYVSAPSSAAFGPGTGAFTVEAFVRPRNMPAGYGAISRTTTSSGLFLGFNGNNTIIHSIGIGDLISSSTYPANNVWSHVAAVRSGTTLSLFLNGSRIGTTSNATDFVTNDLTIGGINGFSQYVNTYISNYRFVKGTAVYDPTQTTYTVPTAPLTAISGTSVLTCQSSTTITDASTNNFTITNSGVSASSLNPFT